MRITESEPMGLFKYAIKSPVTKDRYLKRLENFFNFLGLEGTIEKQASDLISQIKKNNDSWITNKVMNYLQFHKE